MMRALYSSINFLKHSTRYGWFRYLFCCVVFSVIFYVPQTLACDLRLQGLDDLHIEFDHAYSRQSDVGRIYTEQFTIHSRESDCPFFVTFSNSNNRHLENGYGDHLRYELYDSVQHKIRLTGPPTASTQNILEGYLNKTQPLRSLRYYFFVPFDQDVPSGDYSDSIEISIYEGNTSQYTLRDTRRVTYTVTVPANISISIQSSVGIGETADLNFGTLQIGESRSFSIDVVANTPYDLSIESENNGVLTQDTTRAPNTIPYALQYKGRHIDLSRRTYLSYPQRKHTTEVITHKFNAIIGEFDFVLWGEYQDNLVLTVTAR